MTEREIPEIKYTIGFCMVPSENKVLMVHRNSSPNKDLKNGLGGKINYSENESHQACIVREVNEETLGLVDLKAADELKYVGVVTWDVTRGEDNYGGGMHAYIAIFNDPTIIFEREDTREGALEWMDLGEVIRIGNQEIVENIPYFLPPMMEAAEPARYHCTYVEDELINFEVLQL